MTIVGIKIEIFEAIDWIGYHVQSIKPCVKRENQKKVNLIHGVLKENIKRRLRNTLHLKANSLEGIWGH